MAKAQLDKVLTALAGEFLVAGHLCIKGYVASLTLKNYPGVDIFCLNPKNGKEASIQVKTIRGGNAYYVPEAIGQWHRPFVFVRIDNSGLADFFVLPSDNVATLSAAERENYLRSHPNARPDQPRMLSVSSIEPFKDRWDLLGLD